MLEKLGLSTQNFSSSKGTILIRISLFTVYVEPGSGPPDPHSCPGSG